MREENPQMHAPVYEALEQLKKRRVVPFDVPGHKRGRGNPELVELLGEKCVYGRRNDFLGTEHGAFCL